MTFSSTPLLILFSGFVLALQSCSSGPTDLAEYGYRGAVKSIVSKSYMDLEKQDGEWIIDTSKLNSITTVTFNEQGNMIEAATAFPNLESKPDVLTYSYEDNVKTSFLRINSDGDTLGKGIYKWIDEFNFELHIDLDGGGQLIATSKLNENYRDLSGGSIFTTAEGQVFTRTYKNVIDDRNLLTRVDFFEKETKKKTSQLLEYSKFDEEQNPQKIIAVKGETGELIHVTLREFSYFK